MKNTYFLACILMVIPCFVFSQWEECNSGLYGGNVVSLAATENCFFAATGISGGVYKSTDKGNTWEFSGLRNVVISKLFADRTNVFAYSKKVGIFFSSDNGNSWIERDSGLDKKTVFDIVSNSGQLIAATYHGVFVSTDYGLSWWAKNKGLPDSVIYSVSSSGNNIYAVDQKGPCYVSYDKGESWKLLQVDTAYLSVKSICSEGSKVAILNWNNIYLSTDSGSSWSKLDCFSAQFSRLIMLKDGNIYLGGSYGVRMTSDNGNYWVNLNDFMLEAGGIDVSSLLLTDNDIYVGTTTEGIFKINKETRKWEEKNNGLVSRNINAFTSIGNKIYTGGQPRDVFVSSDYGKSWVKTFTPIIEMSLFTGSDLYCLVSKDTILFAGSTNGIYMSTDYGKLWSDRNAYIIDRPVTSIVSSGNHIIIGADEIGLFISNDLGNFWTQKIKGLTSYNISCLLTNGDKIFAGTIGDSGSGIFISTDSCESWVGKSNGLNDKNVSCLAANGSDIYAGTGDGVYYSSDFGVTWEARNDGLQEGTIPLCMIADTRLLAVGTNNGVYISNNKGENWIFKSDGLQGNRINSLFIKDDYIFAGTYGNGIYRAKISDLITGIDNNAAETSGILIFPNPTNDKLYINGEITNKEAIIYDMLGNRILEVEAIQSGNEINISSLTPGTYFIRIGREMKVLIKE